MRRWLPWLLAASAIAAAGGVWWQVGGYSGGCRVSLPAVQLEIVATALDSWRDDNGTYPKNLDALLTDGPAGLGPYRKRSDLLDPWGRQIIYLPHARGRGFQLSTLGADGREGGAGGDSDVVVFRPDTR